MQINANKNCKTVIRALETCDAIMYRAHTNTICFFKHEGLLLEAVCKDKIDVHQLAKNFNKRYVRTYN